MTQQENAPISTSEMIETIATILETSGRLAVEFALQEYATIHRTPIEQVPVDSAIQTYYSRVTGCNQPKQYCIPLLIDM